jgi:hypothetical protein
MDLTKPLEDRSIPIPAPACSKCGGQMEEGFILDDGRNGASVTSWIAGKPEFGFFGVKSADKINHQIVSFACVECGYLESYIRRPKQPAPGS